MSNSKDTINVENKLPNKITEPHDTKSGNSDIKMELIVEPKETKLVNYDCDSKSDDDVKVVKDGEETAEEERTGSRRESRLTNIIEQLSANKLKGCTQRDSHGISTHNGEAAGGARRYARDAAPPAHPAPPAPPAHPAHPAPPAHPALPAYAAPPAIPATATTLTSAQVKTERLSPHDNASSGSRSRSVTPSTSSYPATPPSRGSPHAPALSAPAAAAAAPVPGLIPRNYSDIMRTLAARYNSQAATAASEYFYRLNNGYSPVDSRTAAQAPPVRTDGIDAQVGGLFSMLLRQPGGPKKMPAFPHMLDMTSTKTLLAITRVGRGGRARRKRRPPCTSTITSAEHSPLDLSAGSESASKRARLSISPRSDSDRDRASSEGHGECTCAEGRARLQSWTVDDVTDFVTSIDICAEYASNFREQRIDGAGLPLLTEDHLTGLLQMKLGPALKLRAVLGRKLEPCANCQANTMANNGTNMVPRMNGSSLKSEPRSSTTSPS